MTPTEYPAYRDSNLSWVKSLPDQWGESRLGRLSRIYAGGTPDRTRLEYWRDGTIPWVNSGAVNQGRVTTPSALITPEAFLNSSTRWVKTGALIVALAGQGKTKGTVAQMGIDATCNQSMAAIEPGPGVASRYLFWWIVSNYRNVRSMGGGDLRDGLNLVHIGSIPVPLPSPAEQRQIADYLDAQTAKIDALIGKQERLIATLAERRQAVISHAVTKGLDPTAPMKDSGVEWLGASPNGWRVIKLGHVTSVLTGFPFKSDEYSTDESDIRLLRGANVNPERLVWEDVAFWPMTDRAAFSTYELKAMDLVLGLDRPIVSSGTRVAMVQESDLPALLLQRVARIRGTADSAIEFLSYLLSGPEFRHYLAPIFTGVSVPHMSPDQLRSFRIVLPPLAEQRAIVTHLDYETSQMDALSAKAREMIDILRERRQALISAAVTGKIDVRGPA